MRTVSLPPKVPPIVEQREIANYLDRAVSRGDCAAEDAVGEVGIIQAFDDSGIHD